MTTSTYNNQSGITLLITLLLMGVLLGIGATLLNITLKQLQLSSIALESEIAFQAANAGVECALYYDFVDAAHPFDVPGDGSEQDPAPPSIKCMDIDATIIDKSNGVYVDPTEDNGKSVSGGEQRFRFEWSDRCTEVSIYKFFEDYGTDGDNIGIDMLVDGEDMRGVPCPEGSECTVIQSRGYNVACGDINTGGRVVEREYTQVY